MFPFFHKRIHESVALSAMLAAALTLQIAWVSNWLVHRSELIRQRFTLDEALGPLSGLYLKTVVAYVLLFGIGVLVFRGRDVSHWRERAYGFFLFSVLMFVLLTLPIVYELQIGG
ncbi:hypothetical protein FJZ23_02620 [Candidatus Parcubacteria bacterium]|nr:hypothetical protein [Candidatus Parcubacteria bacterium]